MSEPPASLLAGLLVNAALQFVLTERLGLFGAAISSLSGLVVLEYLPCDLLSASLGRGLHDSRPTPHACVANDPLRV